MSKHTPGPWKLVHHEVEYTDTNPHTGETRDMAYCSLCIETEDGKCVVSEEYGIPRPDMVLMSAAPEMLAALKRAKTVLFNESSAENQPHLVVAWEQICAAIDKAEGRSAA